MLSSLILVAAAAAPTTAASAVTAQQPAPVTPGAKVIYYVDGANGNDGQSGLSGAPWKTIQKAANSATPGSTVLISPGVYSERVVVSVSGNAVQGMITFRGAVPGGTVLDGSSFTNSHFSSWSGAFGKGLLDITDQSYVRFQDMEIRNLSTSSINHFLMGVHVAKTQADPNPMSNIELIRLNVHDIRYTGSNDSGGAQGIAFYGGSVDQAITNVLIRGCEVHNLRLGQSESLTLNGNVDGFLIAKNYVHDNDNIGIVAIGWEGTAGGSDGDDSSNGNAHIYGGHHPLDRARNGVIRNNMVTRCSTEAPVKNPTYPNNDFSAGGIYVDGGKSILIERNTVDECDIGIEIGCEHGGVDLNGDDRDTRDIICRNNQVYYCGQYGIGIGGYNSYRGVAVDCQILNNTIYKCSSLSWGGGQLLVAKSHDNLFANNILVARGASDINDYDGYKNSGWDWLYDHGVVLGSSVNATHNYGNTLDSNLYFCEGGSGEVYWKWEQGDGANLNQGWGGLNAIDVNGLFADPMFTAATDSRTQGSEDFRISTPTSLAVDSGDTALPDIGGKDFAGLVRIWNGIVDRGCHERNH